MTKTNRELCIFIPHLLILINVPHLQPICQNPGAQSDTPLISEKTCNFPLGLTSSLQFLLGLWVCSTRSYHSYHAGLQSHCLAVLHTCHPLHWLRPPSYPHLCHFLTPLTTDLCGFCLTTLANRKFPSTSSDQLFQKLFPQSSYRPLVIPFLPLYQRDFFPESPGVERGLDYCRVQPAFSLDSQHPPKSRPCCPAQLPLPDSFHTQRPIIGPSERC